MPRLTQIKETKKGRLALFLDGEFAFSLDEDTFAAAALHQDDELEDWQIEELRKKSETRRALDKAMDYLSLRDHAGGELYQKLCRKFDAHSAAYAVARAGELGLLNDVSFARRRAAELLEMMGLAGRRDHKPGQLSGGEQQRVAIARALAKNPKLLLCDEPTGALDYVTGKQILKLLQDTCREKGVTVVVITHNSALTPMADRVIHIKNGTVETMQCNETPQSVETIEW